MSIKFAGRLQYFYEKWCTLTNDQVILDWIVGYKLPLSRIPIQTSSPKEKVFKGSDRQEMLSAITQLQNLGAIRTCSYQRDQFVSRIFLADKSGRRKRFILNLKQLNHYIQAPHFKMEDTRTVTRLFQKDNFAATIDLKDAYYLIPVQEECRKYLRFSFEGKLYEFTCLPNGLASAPYMFTKLLKPVIKFLRSNGIIVVSYLDDFLILGSSEQECHNNVQFVVKLLLSLGFVINDDKSVLVPSKRCKFLGFIFSSLTLTMELPLEKRERILKLINFFVNKRSCKIRKFAQFIGTLTSACPAIKYGWLYTKRLERAKYLALKSNQGNYNSRMLIPNTILQDLHWWLRKITISYNQLQKDNFSLENCTDASLSGWGAYCEGESTRGWWDHSEKDNHINFLELKAILYGLKCFAGKLDNCNILIRTDNTTALAYINRMGSVQHPTLNYLARKIWQWCEVRELWIFASYISSADNWQADIASRILPDETEWSLDFTAFNKIVRLLGLPDIDLFASKDNSKCKRYVSWFKDPGSVAVDAFTLDWGEFFFYAFPPFSLILRALQKIINDKATGILVVPLWKSQPWFPLFTKLAVSEFVTFMPYNKLLFSPYSNEDHPLAKNLTLVAARLSGRHLS